ncbi:hypothetical protein Cgig2_013956 [Carnegiea gigantea]|uniref:S-protein homolog n=1 Tax=Carnegiea gigantea TaxID=171969 RepID=A0A9Q1QR83_9CARY|nr:hypothetical protein Cgig2_013956 [Carnegiea gigantea]
MIYDPINEDLLFQASYFIQSGIHPPTQMISMASVHMRLAFFFLSLTVAQLSITCATPIFEADPHRILKGLFPKTHIYINNTLGGGRQAKVHCRSSVGADKGDQVIDDGQTYEFGFTPSIFCKIWRCDFSFFNGTVAGRIYDYNRDWSRCFKHCRYAIANDGVHGYDKDGQDDIFLQWEKVENTSPLMLLPEIKIAETGVLQWKSNAKDYENDPELKKINVKIPI